ncbi:hypothetical protein YPPY66_3741, partial [Yersinia pestis PY-66]
MFFFFTVHFYPLQNNL